ncbi:MAG: glycoside hydrolase family 95 protein, partial [Bacteroidales bacterium]|nr:glycoside hydrolase family 95 protein [Bacteroidales bacterium]
MKIKNLIIIFLSGCMLSFYSPFSQSQELPSGMKIWFNEPADNWNEALPVGNGRLGAMVFGEIEKERIELNEESVWTGEQRWDANPEALKSLPKVRQLLFEGKYKEAEALAQKSILAYKPQNPVATYQALGDLYLDFGSLRGVTNYHRELDIEDAIARVTYSFNQVNFTREIFSSAPDQAIVVRLTADKPGEITFNSWLSRQENKSSIKVANNEIIMSEHVGDGIGVKMYTRMRLITEGGNISSDGDSIRIEKANSVTIY